MSTFSIILLLGISVGYILAVFLRHLINPLSADNSLKLKEIVCASCGAKQGLGAKFPIYSYLRYQGRCTACGHKDTVMSPLLELLTILFAIWAFTQLDFFSATQMSVLFFALLGIAVLDITKWIIPNIFVLVIVMTALIAIVGGDLSLIHSLGGLGVALIVSGLMLLPQLISKPESGYAFGDVKMSLAVALWLGWILSVYVFFLASILAFITWIIMGFFQGFSARRPLQFGPFVALSTMVFGIGRAMDPQFITHLLTFKF